MILLTVGTQLPFDRFVRIVDDLAPSLEMPVFAQIGHTDYAPRNMTHSAMLGPTEFDDALKRCKLIVSHAGVGTVVMAQKHEKPLILFPRRASMKEHRNDHQMATVRALTGRSGIYIATDQAELESLLFRNDLVAAKMDDVNPSREHLRTALADFIKKNLR